MFNESHTKFYKHIRLPVFIQNTEAGVASL